MKKLIYLLAFLTVISLPAVVFAAEGPEYSTASEYGTASLTTIRAESLFLGFEGTLPPVILPLNDGETMTVLEALDYASGGDYEADFSDYGVFITGILGASDETGRYFWMFCVNDEYVWDSADVCVLKPGDELVFFTVDWEVDGFAYAFFKPNVQFAMAGEPFTLTLMGNDYSEGLFPVEGAEIIVTPLQEWNGAYAELAGGFVTGAGGAAEITLHGAGDYIVSAVKLNGAGNSVISSPYCEVTVMDENFMSNNFMEYYSYIEALLYDMLDLDITPYLDEGQSPYIYEEESETLLLPFRAVAEAVGAAVYWDDATKTASAAYGGASVSFALNDVLYDTNVRLIGERTYVPMEFMLEFYLAIQ